MRPPEDIGRGMVIHLQGVKYLTEMEDRGVPPTMAIRYMREAAGTLDPTGGEAEFLQSLDALEEVFTRRELGTLAEGPRKGIEMTQMMARTPEVAANFPSLPEIDRLRALVRAYLQLD